MSCMRSRSLQAGPSPKWCRGLTRGFGRLVFWQGGVWLWNLSVPLAWKGHCPMRCLHHSPHLTVCVPPGGRKTGAPNPLTQLARACRRGVGEGSVVRGVSASGPGGHSYSRQRADAPLQCQGRAASVGARAAYSTGLGAWVDAWLGLNGQKRPIGLCTAYVTLARTPSDSSCVRSIPFLDTLRSVRTPSDRRRQGMLHQPRPWKGCHRPRSGVGERQSLDTILVRPAPT